MDLSFSPSTCGEIAGSLGPIVCLKGGGDHLSHVWVVLAGVSFILFSSRDPRYFLISRVCIDPPFVTTLLERLGLPLKERIGFLRSCVGRMIESDATPSADDRGLCVSVLVCE